jgi:hypothetical protein
LVILGYDYVREIVERDYKTYSGLILEKYFTQQFIENKQFSLIGNYWESRNINEIDIVAVNDLKKQISFFEIKRQKSKIDLSILEKKSQNLLVKFDGFTTHYVGLSMKDM